MIFHKHPWADDVKEFAHAVYSRVQQYSFLCLKDNEGWKTSYSREDTDNWSASDTIEGPFKTLREAQENCKRIFKQLRRKN